MAKLKDIERFTRVGEYETKFPLKRFLDAIDNLIEEDELDICPDFQRGHVWTEEQQIKFIEYLLKGGKTGNIIYINHPNWMGSFAKDPKNPCVLVDGLQRLTAVRRYLNREFKVFGKYYDEWEDSDIIFKRSSTIEMGYNINNLKTRKEVLKWYIEMNSGGTPHTEEEIERVKKLYELE